MSNFRRIHLEDDDTSSSSPPSAGTGQNMGDTYQGDVIANVVGGSGNTNIFLPKDQCHSIITVPDHDKEVVGPYHGGVFITSGHSQFDPTLDPLESVRLLRTLPGWDLEYVRFDESKACLDGTRQQLIDDVRAWVHSPNGNRVLWLSGGAGTGKSSVAHSSAAFFDRLRCLGACFFFNRDSRELNSPKYLIANLCYQLAHFNRQLRGKILSAIQTMGHITASSLQSQARRLIVETATEANLVGPVVVVVDAIDEAGSKETRESLLNAITAEFPNLPDSIKVIITSRDEQDIRIALETCSDEICIEQTEKTTEDIASYVQDRLAKIRRRSGLPDNWPNLRKLQALCLRSGRLFIWASVACGFIENGSDHTRRLNELLDVTGDQKGSTASPLSKLHFLYNHILESAFPIQEGHRPDFHYVVGSIVTLEAPLTRIELDSLLGLGNDSDEDALVLPNNLVIHLSSSAVIINRLRSILREDTVAGRGKAGPIRLLHPSLYDFLTIHAKNDLRIDVIEQHQMLAIRCLDIMNDQLKFDICDIGDPSLPNKSTSEARQYMSAELCYSCFSFVYHITKVPASNPVLIEALEKLVCQHILHWIEAMSLLEAVTKAEDCLRTLTGWMKDQPGVDEWSKDVVCDAILLLKNCGQAIRWSGLHTYYSALPVTPKTRKLFKCYVGKVPGIPNIVSSHPLWPVASVRILEGHTSFVKHVVFSPDGKKLASASDDNTLRLWDVESGQPIGEALEGHTSWVNHTVFSPDGKKLASASNDATLQLWDVESGQPIGEALRGHTLSVNHVVFSPDGKKLASASDDNTLQLWDVESGQPIGEALEGHTSWVNHTVFSPDGKKLASASSDTTLQLWDVESGQPIGEVLKGHTLAVNHIVFSPGGKMLASASSDTTLRLWDVESGQPIGEALRGHTSRVNYVVFSPDGKKLASASDDTTLRLWDVGSGQPIGEALKGHTSEVNHIVFSPDGKKLASASNDTTLQLWDVENGQPIGEALKSHTLFVRSVFFSPDGKKLASSSYDNTLGLWDVESGQPIEEPLTGHTSFTSIVLSPDEKRLASTSDDNTLRLWDVESGQPIGEALTGHTSFVVYAMFSPDGKKLASASSDTTLRLWDVESGQPIGEALKGHTLRVNHIVFSPDGKMLASASDDATLRLWDVESGQPIGEALKVHTSFVYHISFSPDGKKLASALSDLTLRLWDVESGQPIGEVLEGHTSFVVYVVFSPDGEKLASVSSDKILRLWDVESGQPIGEALEVDTSPVNPVVFLADGKKLAWSSYNHTIRLWDVERGQLIEDANATLPLLSSHETFPLFFSFDQHGFLRCLSKRLLWLPIPLRGSIALSRYRSSFAIGSRSGAVTFIRWPVSLSHVIAQVVGQA